VFVRRYLTISVLLAAAVLPVIIGASCPPPSAPYFVAIGTNTAGIATEVPDCTPGFVCISVVNTAYISADVSLYVHDGFDLDLDYCQWNAPIYVGTPQSASQYCPGYNLGEFQIARTQLFNPTAPLPSNLFPMQGVNVRILQPRETLLVRIQEGDIKTFGVEVGRTGTLPDTPEIQNGPYYRCTLVNLGFIRVPRVSEHVPSGETFQFVIYDENDGAAPGLAQFAMRTGTSSTGGCPAVQ